MADFAAELKKQNELLLRSLEQEKQARGLLEAKLEVLLQQVAAKSEPERIEMLRKQAIAAAKKLVKDAALAVAEKSVKGKEKVTHVRYVTASYYHRKGVLYPPGTVLKIPVAEDPAEDWKPWQPPRISRSSAVDPDASVPFGDLRSSSSAIAAVKRDEARAMAEAQARGDIIISGAPDNVPDQGEARAPIEQQPQTPAPEQGPESALTTRASDTDVG
jgi:hypothetical protein